MTVRLGARIGLALAAAALAAPVAWAHDFWIEPLTFEPPLDVRFAVALYVGEGLVGEPVARKPSRIERFVLEGSRATKIGGRKGAHPAGFARAREAGLHIVAYESDFAAIELEAAKFEAYLRAEGLERIVALRAERGESDRPGRELYARCAKALVAAGGSAAGADRAIGLPLELLAERNPYAREPGAPLDVRLLHQGAPLEGALVVALSRARPGETVEVRTDREGRATLELAASGMWLVKAVHMVEAQDQKRGDWASYWASLTFEIPSAAPTHRVGVPVAVSQRSGLGKARRSSATLASSARS